MTSITQDKGINSDLTSVTPDKGIDNIKPDKGIDSDMTSMTTAAVLQMNVVSTFLLSVFLHLLQERNSWMTGAGGNNRMSVTQTSSRSMKDSNNINKWSK